MTVPESFRYNSNTDYQIGGVYTPTHQFSLVNQTFTIKPNGSFQVRFPDLWVNYKIPVVKDPEIYNTWLTNPMQFWQNQLNFAIWCTTSGCGVSKINHLQCTDPIIRSIFRFHAYYQIRRILNEMKSPMPNDQSFNALNNGIDKNAFERLCSEFGISPQSDFRQRLDHSNGMGAVRYYSLHGLRGPNMTKVLERAGDYDPSLHWTIHIPSTGHFGRHDSHTYKIQYIEQYFSKGKVNSRMRAVDPKVGSPFDAVGSFVLDKSNGFTQAGVARINDSIRTFVWAVLGAQSQVRSSILGGGNAFDVQKQFLANVEDAINAPVDIPNSIDRYQSVLQYARSKVDYIIGIGLYMIPNNIDLCVGRINGYNNLIIIASPDEISEMQLGHNNKVNDEQIVPQETFTTPPDNFDAPALSIDETALDAPALSIDETALDAPENQKVSHDEKKILLTLAGITVGSFLIWFSK